MLDQLIAPDIKAAIKDGDLADILEYFRESHPADAADALSGLEPQEALEILRKLEQQEVADIFCELSSSFQSGIAEQLDPAELTELVSFLSPDDRVDLLKSLPEERMDEVMPSLDKSDQDEVNRLVAYPEGTAGSIMTTEYIALPAGLSVAQAMARIRKEAPDKESVYNSYIIDRGHRPVGVVNLRDLILAEPEFLLRDIMDDQVASVGADEDREESIYKLTKYALVDLPVVNAAGAMVGIITHDDAMVALEHERTEDMERFMAISGTHEDAAYLDTSVWTHFSHRVVWLVVLAAFGLVSGAILQGFESTLTSLMILAFYMPMLAGTGGNTGSQSATMVVRALALKEIGPRDALRVLWKEFRIAFMLGLILGVLAFARVVFFSSGTLLPAGIGMFDVGLAIAVALTLQVISATVLGAALPLAAARLGADPALVASPALATVVDITGLLLYFTTARVMLGV
ncbi:MAG: magnesium transporter [Spirochaetota bacterium]